MARTRVFRSGNSQAVRIPREFQFDVDEVEIERRGDEIVIRKPVTLVDAFDALAGLPDDFFAEGRKQPSQRKRPRF
jgi:antitoxin VapB